MITTKIETISVEQAKALLGAQDEATHRRIKKGTVDRYASDMAAGRWELNGESVVFNGDRILDGRHRLAAAVQSGKPLVTVVVRGVSSDCFATIDQGTGRTSGDVLQIAGVKNARQTASIGRLCHLYDRNATMDSGSWRTVSMPVLLAYVNERPWIAEAASWVAANKRYFSAIPSVVGAIYALTENTPTEREVFFDDFCRGTNLSARAPAYMLRERFRQRQLAQWTAAVQGALFVKAWNAEITGKPIKILAWRPATEPFPLLVTRPPADPRASR